MKSFLNQKVRLAFGFAILTLVLMGSLCYRWMVLSEQSSRRVRHTHEVVETIQDLNLATERIESASRAFALTGKDSDLEDYGPDVQRALHDVGALHDLTVDNPEQQAHFPALGTLITGRIRHADGVIHLRRTQGMAAAATAIGTDVDEPVENTTTGKMQLEELRLLTMRMTETDRDRSRSRLILIVGTLLGILVVVIAARSLQAEIARRRVSEGALQENEQKHRMMLDGVQDYAILMLDPRGTVTGWSASAERMKGYSAPEIAGRNFSCLFSPGDIERRRPEEVLRLAALNGLHEEVVMRVRKNGSQFLANVALSALRDSMGTLLGFSEICHDLTEERKSDARYRGLLEAAPDGMVVVNEAGEIVLLNARAEKQFGYHRDELLGLNVKQIIPEGFAERLITDALRSTTEAQAQQIGTGIELHGRRKDGTDFPIEIMLSPLENADGVLVTAAIRDISERKQLARQLQQSQKMEAVGQLTGGIAHDFNNLLGVIIGNLYFLDLLVAGNEAAIKRVKTAQKAAGRGVDITRRLLMFSSNEELQPDFVSLEASIQNVIEMASRGLGLDIRITTAIDQSVPAVYVDRAALESALLNLVVNARDAMPKGGSILISSRRQDLDDSHPAVKAGGVRKGCFACTSVTDTGQGMSQATLDRACEPFFTTKAPDKGTGLGLAMVYGFAKQSGGSVHISSELGLGTTVSFYLPIVEDLAPPGPKSAPKTSNAKLHGTVLIVDDEVDLLEVALVYLSEMGLTVLAAKDGNGALKTIQEHGEINLMITDIVMPGGMNGADLAQKARALRPNLLIIYSSGFPVETLAGKTVTMEDGPLLRKPYQRAEFAAIVHSVMEGSAVC